MPNTIEYDGMSVNELVGHLSKAGVNASEANVIAAGWILENIGRLQRTFNYQEPFPPAIPECTPDPFVRSFVHTNWVDGEDVVQAGDANGKEGFNARFHKIEKDIDQLGEGMNQTTKCLANMRASLRNILDEIRAEINSIHRRLHSSQLQLNESGNRSPQVGAVDIGRYLGTSVVLGKTVNIWETRQGILTLPAIEYMGIEAIGGPRVTGAGKLNGLVQDDSRVREFGANQFNLSDLIAKFGDRDLGDGVTLVDLVDVLPRDAKYANWQAMINDVAERNAAFIRTNNTVQSAVAAAIGLDADTRDSGSLTVERLDTIPKKARVALAKNGVNTLEDLARRQPSEVAEIMKKEQLDLTAGAAAQWIGQAKTLSLLSIKR